MELPGNGGVVEDGLLQLHVHVLLVAPLCAGDMPQAGVDQHEGRVPIRETTYHAGAPADLPVKPLNDIVGADASPMLRVKIGIGQSFFHTVFNFLGGLLQLHGVELCNHRLGLSSGRFLLSWAWIALSILATSLGTTEKILQ